MAYDEKILAALEDRLFPGRCLIDAHDGDFAFNADQVSWDAFTQLQRRAALCGIELKICSAYRSFVRQLDIFTAKFNGRRPVLGPDEQPLNISAFSTEDKIKAITYFSAVPGLSRHHLGTDFDVYASNLLPPGQKLQLTFHEYEPGAYFYPLGQFLQQEAPALGFTQPFLSAAWHGGLEPWHLSFAPRADELLKKADLSVLEDLYAAAHCPFGAQLLEFSLQHAAQLLIKR